MRLLAGEAPGQTEPTPKPDSSVAELQRTLKTYAQLTQYPPADPGVVDGIVGTSTALAVIMIVPRVPRVPDEIKALARLGPLALSNDDVRVALFKAITSYASYISGAIIAMQVVTTATGTAPPAGGGRPAHALAPDAYTGAVTGWQVYTTPGGAVPTNPATAIFYRDFWTQSYRVAVPRGAGLGAGGYVNYVEVSPAKSRPALGTEVSRDTFMSATGKWWGTTVGILGIAVAAVGGGAGVYYGARALRR